MEISIGVIREFVAKQTGCDICEITDDIDIFQDLGCVGDDFHELIEIYAQQFEVNMSSYLWYFHTDEEGCNLGAFFFKPPHQRVKRIAVTPAMLHQFAEKREWGVVYPEHSIPKRRIDMYLSWLLYLLIGSFILFVSC